MPKIVWKYHGKEYSKERSIWLGMKSRCYKPQNHAYHRYGGRGITVCKRWINNFDAFFEDMGFKPEGKALDRIDNNKGYSKENCRWATYKENANNTRKNVFIEVNGIKKSVQQISIETGLKMATIFYRFHKGKPIDQIIQKEKLPNNIEKPIKHGTYYSYQNRLCRCESCKKAASIYKAKRYKIRKETK